MVAIFYVRCSVIEVQFNLYLERKILFMYIDANPIRPRDDIPGMVFFSLVGLVICWVFGLVPYVGVLLASVAIFFLGMGLGYILMCFLPRVIVVVSTVAGYVVGFSHGTLKAYASVTQPWFYIAIIVAGGLFTWGYNFGYRKATKEERRDAGESVE